MKVVPFISNKYNDKILDILFSIVRDCKSIRKNSDYEENNYKIDYLEGFAFDIIKKVSNNEWKNPTIIKDIVEKYNDIDRFNKVELDDLVLYEKLVYLVINDYDSSFSLEDNKYILYLCSSLQSSLNKGEDIHYRIINNYNRFNDEEIDDYIRKNIDKPDCFYNVMDIGKMFNKNCTNEEIIDFLYPGKKNIKSIK